MKKCIYAFVFMIFSCFALESQAAPLDTLTVDTLQTNWNNGAKGTDYAFDFAKAQVTCNKSCTAMVAFGTDAGLIINYDDKTKNLMGLTITIRLTYPDLIQMATAHLNAATFAKVALKSVDPQISDGEIETILKQVSVYSEPLLEGVAQTYTYEGMEFKGSVTDTYYTLVLK